MFGTCKYLIARGVDIHDAAVLCYDNLEIAKALIHAGATTKEMAQLLLNAATRIDAIAEVGECYKVIKYLWDTGVRPDFKNPEIFSEWKVGMDCIHQKIILECLVHTIQLPESIKKSMRKRVQGAFKWEQC